MRSIEYFCAGKAYLAQVHAVHPALSLVISVDCMHLLQIALQLCCSQPWQPRIKMAILASFGPCVQVQYGTWYTKSRSLVAQGRWSLYPVQFLCRTVRAWKKKKVVKSRWSLKPEPVACTRLYCTKLAVALPVHDGFQTQ